jgi:cobalt-zinc-cadmium efflux system outer membrane protein
MIRPASVATPVSVIVCLLAGGASAAPPTEPDIPADLSLSEALRLFRRHGLDSLIAETQVQSAVGDVGAAEAVPNPNLAAGFSRSFFNAGLYETPNGWSVGIGDSSAIEDTLSGKRGLRIGVAEAALAAARLQRADAQRTLEQQLKQQYVQALVAGASLAFARGVAGSTNRTLELVRLRYSGGAISEVDVVKTETAKLEADRAIERAAEALREAKVAIGFLLGRRRALTDFAIDPRQLRFFTPPALKTTTAEALLGRAFDARPDLGAQARQRERASQAIALAKRLRFPDIAAGVQYQQEGSGTTSLGSPSAITPPTIALSLSTTLPVFYQQQGEIKRAEADLDRQEAELAKVRAQIIAEVETAFSAYLTARTLVQLAESRLLERATRARDLVAIQYEKGAASLLEFLDSERTYIAVNAEYLQDLGSYWSAVLQLEAATATELMP